MLDLYPGPHNDVAQVYIDDGAAPDPDAWAATSRASSRRWTTQPTVNKAKAGQTIPMKWTLNAKSFATTWEDYYRYNTESNARSAPLPR